jgi:predicted transcriptional regulator
MKTYNEKINLERQETCNKILELLFNEKMKVKDLCKLIERSRETTHYFLTGLLEFGYVKKELTDLAPKGRVFLYSAENKIVLDLNEAYEVTKMSNFVRLNRPLKKEPKGFNFEYDKIENHKVVTIQKAPHVRLVIANVHTSKYANGEKAKSPKNYAGGVDYGSF